MIKWLIQRYLCPHEYLKLYNPKTKEIVLICKKCGRKVRNFEKDLSQKLWHGRKPKMVIVKIPTSDLEACPFFGDYFRTHETVINVKNEDYPEILSDLERLKRYEVKCGMCGKKYDFDGKVAKTGMR